MEAESLNDFAHAEKRSLRGGQIRPREAQRHRFSVKMTVICPKHYLRKLGLYVMVTLLS